MKHKFTKTELKKLLNDNFDKTMPEIAGLVGMSNSGFWNHLKKYELTKKSVRFNEHSFKTIKNEKTAYWLGFLMADGCVFIKNNQNFLDLVLAGKDETHLSKFHRFLNSKIRIRKYELEDGRTVVKGRHYSKILCNNLINHGCISQKSLKLEFPNIPTHLLNHFIRGYFDGDGCISIHNKNQKTPSMRITIIGTKNFLDHLQSIFTMFSYKIKKYRKYGNAYGLEIEGNTQCEQILQWLYSDASTYLKRKHKIWKNFRAKYLLKPNQSSLKGQRDSASA